MYISSTIGPNISDPSTLEKLIDSGCNMFRLNFSWGTHSEYIEIIKNIRQTAKNLNKNVYILQDLQGPKLRIENCPTPMQLEKDKSYTFSYQNPDTINLKAKGLYNESNIGKHILIKDGDISLEITDVNSKAMEIRAIALNTGEIKNRNGANAPQIELGLEPLSNKDIKDLEFALSQKVDIISLSFIHTESDIIELKKLIGTKAQIMAKIETEQAVANIDKILEHANFCMVARGDLGVEIGLEKLPQAQLKILKSAEKHKVKALIATEVLKTMIESTHPSRAEANDIYYAVQNGAKGFILTNETVTGKHPVKAIDWLYKLSNSYQNPEKL